MERITVRDLEAVCLRINNATHDGPYRDEFPVWERTEDGLRQVPGVYHLSGAYGGYALHRNCEADGNGESHGINDVFGGHMPKRELYGMMQAFLRGVDARERYEAVR